jgi:hypothetical protein
MVIFILLLVTISFQQTNLPLATPTTVKIDSSLYQIYTVQVPPSIETYQDMFITTTPIVDLPTQIPLITIKAKNFQSKCFQANN